MRRSPSLPGRDQPPRPFRLYPSRSLGLRIARKSFFAWVCHYIKLTGMRNRFNDARAAFSDDLITNQASCSDVRYQVDSMPGWLQPLGIRIVMLYYL